MELKELVAITADLAKATNKLSDVAAKLEGHYSRSLNALEAINEGIDCPPKVYETDESFEEDMGLVKNLDILPPVEVRENETKLDENDDVYWEFASSQGVTTEEAMEWMKAHNYRPEWLMEKGLLTEKAMVVAYTKEYLRQKAAKPIWKK